MSYKVLKKKLNKKGITIKDLKEQYKIKGSYVKKQYLIKKLNELGELKEAKPYCTLSLNNTNINPNTKHKIKKGSDIHKKLIEKCEVVQDKHSIIQKNVYDKKEIDNIFCEKFIQNPNINPRTGRKIKKDGPTYKKLIKECRTPKEIYFDKKEIDNIFCGKFIQNPNINPRTGRKIKKDGPTYKKLIKECGIVEDNRKITKENKRIQKNTKYILSPNIKDVNYVIKDIDLQKTFVRKLGQGSFGTVQLHMLPDRTKVAIKFTKNRNNGEISSEILTEIFVINKLRKCPAIVNFFDVHYVKSWTSVMISYHKSDLLTFSNIIPLSEKIKYLEDIVTQLIYGLYCLYVNGIIHGDIKPENILVDYELNENNELKYVPKLYYGDFGASLKLECDPILRTYPKIDCLYTEPYRPFEILLKCNFTKTFITKDELEYNENADVWALGVTIMHYLTGDEVFWYFVILETGLEEQNMIRNILNDMKIPVEYVEKNINKDIHGQIDVTKILKLYEIYEQVPESIINILEKMLEVNMRDRINIYELIELINDEGLSSVYYSYDEIQKHLIIPKNIFERGQKHMNIKLIPKMENLYSYTIDRLINIFDTLKLNIRTFFSAIDIFDRYLIHNKVMAKHLKLVAITCMYIVSKLIEIHPPTIQDFVLITKYSSREIINMEVNIIKSLNYELLTCDVDVLLNKIRKISPKNYKDVLKKLNKNVNSSASKYKYYNLTYNEIVEKLDKII